MTEPRPEQPAFIQRQAAAILWSVLRKDFARGRPRLPTSDETGMAFGTARKHANAKGWIDADGELTPEGRREDAAKRADPHHEDRERGYRILLLGARAGRRQRRLPYLDALLSDLATTAAPRRRGR